MPSLGGQCEVRQGKGIVSGCWTKALIKKDLLLCIVPNGLESSVGNRLCRGVNKESEIVTKKGPT